MNVNIMLYPASCFDGRYPVIELVYSPVQLIGNFVQHLDNIIKFFDNTRTYPADDCGTERRELRQHRRDPGRELIEQS